TRRHPIVGARHKGWGGRFPDQALQRGGPDAGRGGRPRAGPSGPGGAGGAGPPARPVRVAHSAGAGGDAARRQRPAEQAGGRGTRDQRSHAADSQKESNAKDACRFTRRPGADGGEASDADHPFSPQRGMKVTLGKQMIAVVDDDARLLESLENLFESAGYSVRTFASAGAILESDFKDLDCLITDIGMPMISGFELLDAAKRARPGLPVFLITG